jgi:predicted RNA methylase
MGLKETFKSHIIPSGRRLRRLRGGIAAGSFMYLDLQSQLQRFLGVDEREIMQTMRSLIAKSETLIDVGANDGYYTLAFLRSNANFVIACEPSPASTQLLANAEANGYSVGDRFQVIRTPIGNGEGDISITELLQRKPEPILIKVDVDGAELEILKSAEGYHAKMDASWIVEIHSRKLERDCRDWLRNHGYRTKIVDNAWWRVFIPELRPSELNRWILATSPKMG